MQGIPIPSYLGWTEYVRHVTKKELNELIFIKTSLYFSTHEVKCLGNLTFIRPLLEYATVVWFPRTACSITTLERVQLKAGRFIYNRYGRTDLPTGLFRQADLPTLLSSSQVLRLKFLYQLIRNSLRIIPDFFLTFRDATPTGQRHSWELEEYSFNNNTSSYSCFPRSIGVWNALGPLITQQPTIQEFLKLAEKSVLGCLS